MTVQYFDVDNFSRDPIAVIEHAEPQIDYQWAPNQAPYPDPRLPWDGWTGRWSGLLRPNISEVFTFVVTTDDSVRMWIEDELVLDKWSVHASATYSIPRGLTAGKYYPFRLEYCDTVEEARLRLQWSSLSTPLQVRDKKQPVSFQLYCISSFRALSWTLVRHIHRIFRVYSLLTSLDVPGVPLLCQLSFYLFTWRR